MSSECKHNLTRTLQSIFTDMHVLICAECLGYYLVDDFTKERKYIKTISMSEYLKIVYGIVS